MADLRQLFAQLAQSLGAGNEWRHWRRGAGQHLDARSLPKASHADSRQLAHIQDNGLRPKLLSDLSNRLRGGIGYESVDLVHL